MKLIMQPKPQVIFSGETGHRFSVMNLAAFHHSNRIASCSFDGTVRIWDDKKQQKVLFFFTEAIERIEITSDDSKIIVVLSDSSKAYIHNLNRNKTHEIGEGKLFRNIFGTNANCSITAFVTFDDEVFFYYHDSNTMSSPVPMDDVSGDSLVWLDNDHVCIPKRNGTIAIIDNNSKTITREVPLHDGLITSITRDGDDIISVSEDGTGKVYDLNFNPKFGFKLTFTPQNVCYSTKDQLIVVSGDRNLLFVDTNTGQLTLTDQDLSGCNPIITNNSEIYRGSGENSISQYSNIGEIVDKIDGRKKSTESITFLDNKKLVYGSGDGKVYLLDYRENFEQNLALHSETVSSVIFIPNTNTIVAGSFDDSISIWDLSQQIEIKRIPDIPLVTTLAKSPSNTFFAAGCSGDNTIHVFTIDGERKTSWDAHDDYIGALSFLNDEVIVSGSDDNTVRFWNPSGKLISTLHVSAPIKSIFTNTEFEYNVIGLDNGELLLFEKISNRKISSFMSSGSIQSILAVNNNLLYFSSKEILYEMRLDGPNIISVNEIYSHSEPIKGLSWLSKEEKLISIDHSVEIVETQFIEEIEEPSSTMVTFAPGDPLTEELDSPISPTPASTFDQQTDVDLETLSTIHEYLKTVSHQFNDLIVPKLGKLDINAEPLLESILKLEITVESKLNEVKNRSSEVHFQNEGDKHPDNNSKWKEFDWGTKKH
jgi:WD40 repeat protein